MIYFECYTKSATYPNLYTFSNIYDLRQDSPLPQSSGRWQAFYNDRHFTSWVCEFNMFSADLLSFADLCWYTGIRVRLIDRTLNRNQVIKPWATVLSRSSRQRPASDEHSEFYWALVNWRRDNNSYLQERDEQIELYSQLSYLRQELASVLAPISDLIAKLRVYTEQYAQYTDDAFCTAIADQLGLAQTFAQLWEIDLPVKPTSNELEMVILQGLTYLQYDIHPTRQVEAEWTVNEGYHILAPYVPLS